jgi:hypothetical protein
MLEFSDDYAPLSPVQEPKWRVKTLLMKLESVRKAIAKKETPSDELLAIRSKFAAQTEKIFSGLPKPKDWHTQEEIAGAVEMTQRAISEWEEDFRKKLETDNFLNSPDFDPPIYNVWKQQGIPPRAHGSTKT